MIWRCVGYLCLSLISGAILSVAVLAAWYLADRKPPMTVEHVRVLTPEVRPGDNVQVAMAFVYLRSCKIHSDRVMWSSSRQRALMQDVDFERAPAPLDEVQLSIQAFRVPEDFAEGDAYIQTFPWYACNPVHRYIWPIEPGGLTLRFKVLPP